MLMTVYCSQWKFVGKEFQSIMHMHIYIDDFQQGMNMVELSKFQSRFLIGNDAIRFK